jgi:stringent starvation protein B
MIPSQSDGGAPSTRGYLIRALHQWCTDHGFTPYISVFVDARVLVPTQYVKNNEIVLNVAYEATTSLVLGNDMIEFKARFGGQACEVMVPVEHVLAIYARENGQGMAFPAPPPADESVVVDKSLAGKKTAPELRLAGTSQENIAETTIQPDDETPEPPPRGGRRASLTRIK